MWFLLALLSAFFQVLRNMSMKKLGHSLDETINVWGRFTFLLPFAGAGVLIKGVPEIGPGFWWLALVFGITQTLATLSLSKALKVSDISMVTSLWKMSVIFLVVWGVFALGETPTTLGIAGVVISMVGVYLLNVQKARVSLWAPITSLYTDPGQRWTMLAAMGYAPAVIEIKQMALLSDPVFAVFIAYVFAAAVITPYTIYKSGQHFLQLRSHWKGFVGLGVFGTLSTWFGTTAYTLTVSAYVEAAKQVEILLALGIGYVIFKEGTTIKKIWPGILVMLIGLVLLKIGG